MDPGLRVLGLRRAVFATGVLVCRWTMRNGPPLLAVALAGLNVTDPRGRFSAVTVWVRPGVLRWQLSGV
jgi:hypothetical protein